MTARIRVDPRRITGTIDPGIYGGFIEHLGRCIYGGVFDEGSPLSDEQGFRRDVAGAIRDLAVPVLRWPGGLFASGYHWADGVGPRDGRPGRFDLAWGADESNRFGTDEFLAYCRLVNAEPVICVNMGTGTLDEAASWVRYNRGRVKVWCLGNEMYNREAIGALSADDYVKKAVEFAKVMKMADPTIELIGCGLNGWSRWDRVVLEGLAPFVDMHSIHLYTGSPDYYSNVLAPHLAELAIRSCTGVIEGIRYQQGIKHPIRIAYDEWNVWYRAGNPPWGQWATSDGGLEECYTLTDALAVATFLNVFIRHCASVRMANIAQLVNVLAPIMTSPTRMFRQAIFHPLCLYSRYMRGDALDTYVDCATFDLRPEAETSPWPHRVSALGPFRLLDVTAVRAPSGALNVAVVNRSLDRDITAEIDVPGVRGGRALEVNGPDVTSANTFDAPENVTVVERAFDGSGHRFPAHSLTLLAFAEETARELEAALVQG